MRLFNKLTSLFSVIILFSCYQPGLKQFQSSWHQQPDRYWIGPEYWANRLQDWQIHKGRLECINSENPMRTVHLLDKVLTNRPGNLYMKIKTGLVAEHLILTDNDWTGFLVGAGDLEMDYRARALVHRNHGHAGGLIAAINGKGEILFIDNETGELIEAVEITGAPVSFNKGSTVEMELQLIPKGKSYDLLFTAKNAGNANAACTGMVNIPEIRRLAGNIAIIANGGGNDKQHSFWFMEWVIRGSKLKSIPEQQYGPVFGVLYTISDQVLKLTTQLPPVSPADAQEVMLEVMDQESGDWKQIAVSPVIVPGYIATFRVDPWNSSEQHSYRVVYSLKDNKGTIKKYYYYGRIVSDPVNKEEVITAVFTGNSNSAGMGNGLFDFKNSLWFPHADLTSYVARHQPDLLIYTGDNVYEGRPTPPDFSSETNTELDYLYKWYMFCWAHGVLTRNIPAVTIPDDHDVYHGNLWGAGGKKAPLKPKNGIYPDFYKGFENDWQQDRGGYKLSPYLVNMIQKTQTSHLPDPYNPAPVKQGIGVYYCNMNYGNIGFAILEDRKFKSAPALVLPDKKVINGFSMIKTLDGRKLDHPEAKLLGNRQLEFLEDWSSDWTGVDMKVAISQTIFANLSTYPDTFVTDAGTPGLPPLPREEIPKDYRKAKDMDSNGWPQTGRNKALRVLRKGYAFMIGGDQHLGSVVHHGIDDWEDAGYSFCVPSIANLWPRRWFPPAPGENHQEGMPLYTGRYFDGFGNRITVWAVSNPYVSGKKPALLHDRAPGYGIVRFNKKSRIIAIECWPRHSDPKSLNAEQYPGWPVTVNMEDNYGRKAKAWLPSFQVNGLGHPPVIQVVNETTGEIVYTLRIRDYTYQPKVFEEGTYTVHIGEQGTEKMKTYTGLKTGNKEEMEEVTVKF